MMGGCVPSITQTLHGTAIYAAPLTPLAPPLAVSWQSYGSPMGRVSRELDTSDLKRWGDTERPSQDLTDRPQQLASERLWNRCLLIGIAPLPSGHGLDATRCSLVVQRHLWH